MSGRPVNVRARMRRDALARARAEREAARRRRIEAERRAFEQRARAAAGSDAAHGSGEAVAGRGHVEGRGHARGGGHVRANRPATPAMSVSLTAGSTPALHTEDDATALRRVTVVAVAQAIADEAAERARSFPEPALGIVEQQARAVAQVAATSPADDLGRLEQLNTTMTAELDRAADRQETQQTFVAAIQDALGGEGQLRVRSVSESDTARVVMVETAAGVMPVEVKPGEDGEVDATFVMEDARVSAFRDDAGTVHESCAAEEAIAEAFLERMPDFEPVGPKTPPLTRGEKRRQQKAAAEQRVRSR